MTRLNFPALPPPALPAPATLRALVPALALLFFLGLAKAGEAREIGLHVEPLLKELGVQASVGAILDKTDGAVEAVVFITYEKAFHGKLYVSGFNKDNTEIARSEFVFVDEPAESGGHVVFAFDAQTNLAEAASFALYGNSTPVPKEESAGEKAKKIVRELLE